MITDEQAKALQEVAKTANTALELADKTGGGIIQELCGMATDRLQFWRAKQWLSLQDKWREIHRFRGIDGKTIPISPKLALQIIEAASLEEDETLQAMWARLIANAMDPQYTESVLPAFIDVLKQLSPLEAKIFESLPGATENLPILCQNQQLNDNISEFHSFSRGWFHLHCLSLKIQSQISLDTYYDDFLRLTLLEEVLDDIRPANIGGGLNEFEPDWNIGLQRKESLRITIFGCALLDACVFEKPSRLPYCKIQPA